MFLANIIYKKEERLFLFLLSTIKVIEIKMDLRFSEDGFLAAIEVEILLCSNVFFSWRKRATIEAPFLVRKKTFLNKRLERKAGFGFQKKILQVGRLQFFCFKRWQATYIAPLNRLPLLRSHPGGVCRSWSCRTCRCKDTPFLGFCKWKSTY